MSSPSKTAPGAAPNFEKPADADKDNVYEVTITATDGNANMATRDVKVTVTNAEEPGKVKLSQTRPRVGLAITAVATPIPTAGWPAPLGSGGGPMDNELTDQRYLEDGRASTFDQWHCGSRR